MTNETQIHAARVLLAWSQQDLADRAILSVASIQRLESGAVDPRSSTVNAVKSALEKAGIEFVSGEGVIGVLLRTRKKSSVGSRSQQRRR